MTLGRNNLSLLYLSTRTFGDDISPDMCGMRWVVEIWLPAKEDQNYPCILNKIDLHLRGAAWKYGVVIVLFLFEIWLAIVLWGISPAASFLLFGWVGSGLMGWNMHMRERSRL
jgi:hypothetical protein